MRKALLIVVTVLASALFSSAQAPELHVPSTVIAGKPLVIASSGQGRATLYVLGPSRVIKRSVELGHEHTLPGEDLTASGQYQVVACSGADCGSTAFQVLPASPARISFFVHPSRAPVSTPQAVNATVLVFDHYDNTVLAPTNIEFRLVAKGVSSTRTISSVRGITWFETDSRPQEGKLQIVASTDDISETRVVQQVASEACNLRMSATALGPSLLVQTDPVRDCSGNPLPDGTIVTFAKTDRQGTSTVDTPLKKDRAIAHFQISGPARISVASGAVVGNEISVGARN